MKAVRVQSWLCRGVKRQLLREGAGWTPKQVDGWAPRRQSPSLARTLCPFCHVSIVSLFLNVSLFLFSVFSLVVCLSLCVWLSKSPLSQSTSRFVSQASCSASPKHFLPPDKTTFYLLYLRCWAPLPCPLRCKHRRTKIFLPVCSLTYTRNLEKSLAHARYPRVNQVFVVLVVKVNDWPRSGCETGAQDASWSRNQNSKPEFGITSCPRLESSQRPWGPGS